MLKTGQICCLWIPVRWIKGTDMQRNVWWTTSKIFSHFCGTSVREHAHEGKNGPERESCICDTACLPPSTHIQTASTHHCPRRGCSAWTRDENTLRRLEARTPQNSSVCGLFRGEPLLWHAARSGEGTAVHLKQALCSWDRHGYHGNKNKNSNNKRDRLTTSLFTFSTVWGALVLAKHWFPQLCATTPSCAPKRVTADRATAIMWRLHKIIPKDNTGCWAADLRSRQRAIVEEVVQFKPAQIREMSQSKHRARPGNHSEEENVHRPVTTAG